MPPTSDTTGVEWYVLACTTPVAWGLPASGPPNCSPTCSIFTPARAATSGEIMSVGSVVVTAAGLGAPGCSVEMVRGAGTGRPAPPLPVPNNHHKKTADAARATTAVMVMTFVL